GGTLHRAAAGDVMADQTPTVHASAVLAGARAVLIRGPAGARQAQLAPAVLQAAGTGPLRVARPVGGRRRPSPGGARRAAGVAAGGGRGTDRSARAGHSAARP